MPNLRWPGGNFASAYHWDDGGGPPERRVPRFDLAWHALEPNAFGTDEVLAYARALGAEPYVCVNSGSGTLDEAARWVEYGNLPCRPLSQPPRPAPGPPEVERDMTEGTAMGRMPPL